MTPAILLAQTGTVGIGTSNPDTNAILDLSSTSKALLLPRLKASAVASLPGKSGMMVYNTDTGSFAGMARADSVVTANTATRPYILILGGKFISVGQTYTAPSTFKIAKFGVELAHSTNTLTLNIYQGLGTSGRLLGKSSIIPTESGTNIYYFNFSSDNIKLQKGEVYTLEFVPTGIMYMTYTGNTFGGGYLRLEEQEYGFFDLFFEMISEVDAWIPLATESTLTRYATTKELSEYTSKLSVYAPLNKLSEYAPLSKLSEYATTNKLSEYVSISTAQSITGQKTFTNNLAIEGKADIRDNSDVSLYIRSSGSDMNGMITLDATRRPASSSIDEFMDFRMSGARVGYIASSGAGGVRYSTTSDRRLKENITPTTYGIQDLMKIGVMDYKMKGLNGVSSTGFIAQDLHVIYPHAVTPGAEDVSEKPWTVDYGLLTPLLTKAIQDQQAQIEKLEARISKLEADNKQVAELAGLVKELQQQVSVAAHKSDQEKISR